MLSVTASEQSKAHLRSDGPFGGLLHCKVNRRFFGAGCAKVAWNGTPQSVIVAYRFTERCIGIFVIRVGKSRAVWDCSSTWEMYPS